MTEFVMFRREDWERLRPHLAIDHFEREYGQDVPEPQTVTVGTAEERIAAALAPFGWTCTNEFWKRYYSDPWVFNLANAVERLSRAADLDVGCHHEARTFVGPGGIPGTDRTVCGKCGVALDPGFA